MKRIKSYLKFIKENLEDKFEDNFVDNLNGTGEKSEEIEETPEDVADMEA